MGVRDGVSKYLRASGWVIEGEWLRTHFRARVVAFGISAEHIASLHCGGCGWWLACASTTLPLADGIWRSGHFSRSRCFLCIQFRFGGSQLSGLQQHARRNDTVPNAWSEYVYKLGRLGGGCNEST